MFSRQRLFAFGKIPNQFLAHLARNPQKVFSAIIDDSLHCQTNSVKMTVLKKTSERWYSSEIGFDKLTKGWVSLRI